MSLTLLERYFYDAGSGAWEQYVVVVRICSVLSFCYHELAKLLLLMTPLKVHYGLS